MRWTARASREYFVSEDRKSKECRGGIIEKRRIARALYDAWNSRRCAVNLLCSGHQSRDPHLTFLSEHNHPPVALSLADIH